MNYLIIFFVVVGIAATIPWYAWRFKSVFWILWWALTATLIAVLQPASEGFGNLYGAIQSLLGFFVIHHVGGAFFYSALTEHFNTRPGASSIKVVVKPIFWVLVSYFCLNNIILLAEGRAVRRYVQSQKDVISMQMVGTNAPSNRWGGKGALGLTVLVERVERQETSTNIVYRFVPRLVGDENQNVQLFLETEGKTAIALLDSVIGRSWPYSRDALVQLWGHYDRKHTNDHFVIHKLQPIKQLN